MSLQRDAVVAALRSEDVATHLGITGQWRGRWMRSRRCGQADHSTDAFGISRDGRWHCWSCDDGGDLLKLLAIGEGLDVGKDFPRVLEIAAGIAGVDDDDSFGAPAKPAPAPRPEPPPLVPLAERIAKAKQRAQWVWDRLYSDPNLAELYLKSRGVSTSVLLREPVHATPIRMPKPPDDASSDHRALWWTMGPRYGTHSIAVRVCAVDDGRPVDVRCRRVEPQGDQPKIIGMVGNVTVAPAEHGKPRQLVGCFGRPHAVDADLVVVVEGLMDFLTALMVWPEAQAQVLGAVEAGSLALVAGHAARKLAARDNTSRLLIVEQADPPRTLKDGRVVAGAADASINEDPNAATKVAVRLLGPKRVGWLFCEHAPAGIPHLLEGKPVKDLNDLVRVGADVRGMVRWWTDLAPTGED